MYRFVSEPVTGHVIRIRCPGDVFAYLVCGSRRAALLDTGLGTGSLKKFVEELTDLPVVVILSHGHLDHSGGAVEFEEVYVNRRDYSHIRSNEVGRRLDYAMENGCGPDVEILPPKPARLYRWLSDGDTVDLGGITVEAHDLPGHSPGSMALLIPEERCCLLGDAVNTWGLLHLEDSLTVEDFRDGLIRFEKEHGGRYDTALFSHPHNVGTPAIVAEAIELCNEVLEGRNEDGIPFVTPLGTGILAKPVMDEGLRRVDGGYANFIYRPDRIKREERKPFRILF